MNLVTGFANWPHRCFVCGNGSVANPAIDFGPAGARPRADDAIVPNRITHLYLCRSCVTAFLGPRIGLVPAERAEEMHALLAELRSRAAELEQRVIAARGLTNAPAIALKERAS